jgi:hypothetical protein
MGRVKVVLSYPELHEALGIEPDIRVASVYVRTDPVQVAIVFESDWFNDNPPNAEAPMATLEYVRP